MKKTMRQYLIRLLIMLIGVLFFIAAAMIIVDPYFHYHKPLSFLNYRIYEERYVNDGIARNFDYTGIITGTSMNQNFKTSQAEELFGGSFVKLPYAGGDFAEITDGIQRAITYNPELKLVIWGIDYNCLRREWDYVSYPDKPTYLYDTNIWNDVKYIYNKNILYNGLFNTIERTIKREETTSMDEYSSWSGEYGFDHIMMSYNRDGLIHDVENGSWVYDYETEMEKCYENITKNILPVIRNNPDVTFYLFFPPYNILYWDSLHIENSMEMQLEAEEMTIDQLLEFKNVHLFSFFENTDLICDYDHYRNKEHYNYEVNEMMLEWMAAGQYEITKENKDEHMQRMYDFYMNYDYNGIFEK